jgi:DNA-binding transcriptional ArsR family regulator
MKPPFQGFVDLDRVIHEPARLAIVSALQACEAADFLFLQRLTGLTKGNLSSHLATLEGASFVDIQKSFSGKIPVTRVSLTAAGRGAIRRYWQRVDATREGIRAWRPEPRPSFEST